MADHAPDFAEKPAIAVIGNINLDIKISRLHPSEALFVDGESSVQEIYESIGGGGANVAVAAAKLGGTVHFCGCVGDDELGRRLNRSLASFGVIPHLSAKDVVTGRSINLNWDNHHRHFVSCLPNAATLVAEDIDLDILAQQGCRHLFRADLWFAGEMLTDGNEIVLRRAVELGMETSIDINWDPEWSKGDDRASLEKRKGCVTAILPFVTWVHGNERELAIFTDTEGIEEACRLLLDRGAGGVIIHRGKKGSAAFTANEGWIESPASPVERVVCETGTGDVFSAAFMLFGDLPLRERLHRCGVIAAEYLSGTRNLDGKLVC